jgi:general secretion pathway protein A
MYLEHYGLKVKPFQISADPRFLWLGSKHKEALAILKYGIFDNRGFLLLSGDVGTGKTTLIHALTRDLGDDTVVATVPDPGLQLMDFYRYIARSFHIQAPFETKEQFLEVFETFLLRNEALKKKVLLIVDEAQRLTSELLEEIRLLSNIEKDYTKLLNIFFVGQNEFNDIILKQKNRPLRQRITINYNINPLEQHEVMEYINFRLGVAGCKDPLFTGDAVKEVFAFSEGYPRLINIVCDHALLTGFVQGVARITGSIVSECAEELNIRSMAPAPAPLPEPFPQAVAPSPTVYPAPSQERAPARGLSSTQTMLVVILGILCFVAGLLVFSLRNRDASTVSSRHIGEAAAVPGEGAGEGPAPLAVVESETKGESGMPVPLQASLPPPSADHQAGSQADAPISADSADASRASPRADATPGSAVPSDAKTLPNAVDAAPAAFPMAPPAPPAPVVSFQDLLADPDALTVNFKVDSNELTPKDMQGLDRIAALMKARDDIRAKVTGYTDAVGNLHYNLKVSEFRANIVKTYLVGKGVAGGRITTAGMGPANPVASNDSLEGRRRNRRVEIELRTVPMSPSSNG